MKTELAEPQKEIEGKNEASTYAKTTLKNAKKDPRTQKH
jgi:hypothetical protein